jgi:hypothetical protein
MLLLLPLLAVAVVSFVYVRSHQGDGAILAAAQRHAQVLTPAGVARVVQTAPDPDTNQQGSNAKCVAEGRGELHNPWQCSIVYPSGKRLDYTVQIAPDGSYTGDHQIVHDRAGTRASNGEISGCCIAIP